MPPQSKKMLLAVLVSAFVLQSALVYRDEPTGRLDEAGARGRVLWHQYGCQVCHQLYGQGGFLGPDLTNAYSRVDSMRIRTLLTVGSGQMPPFHLRDGQIDDIRAFLQGMDRPSLGEGQLRMGRADSAVAPWGRFESAVAPLLDSSMFDTAREGWKAFRSRACIACHLPLAAAPNGPPDLSHAAARLTADELHDVLTNGRPTKGMPPPVPAFTDTELENVIAFFSWLDRNRAAVDDRMRSIGPTQAFRWRDVPWWEYR